MKLPQIPNDKAQHFIYGCVAYLFLAGSALAVGFPHPEWFGLAAAAGLGAGKEIADLWLNKRAVKAGAVPTHHVAPLDAAATALGGLACFMGSVLV
jgi:hypothetical protein